MDHLSKKLNKCLLFNQINWFKTNVGYILHAVSLCNLSITLQLGSTSIHNKLEVVGIFIIAETK